MPQLSPTMTGGRIAAWSKDLGDEVECYDLVLEINADNVMDAANSEVHGTTSRMLLEACDEGVVARILQPASISVTLPPGTPLAVLCEDHRDAAKYSVECGWRCPSIDAAQDADELKSCNLEPWTWQAYTAGPAAA